jgi:hypothetical protein
MSASCAVPPLERSGGHLEGRGTMKPKIDRTVFGSITIEGMVCEKDVIIRLGGEVKKRKKKLSKAIYGTSHTISLDEAKHIYQKGAERLIVGTGQFGYVQLSDEAKEYFVCKGCTVDLLPTQDALEAWNQAEGAVIGMFHVTC